MMIDVYFVEDRGYCWRNTYYIYLIQGNTWHEKRKNNNTQTILKEPTLLDEMFSASEYRGFSSMKKEIIFMGVSD